MFIVLPLGGAWVGGGGAGAGDGRPTFLPAIAIGIIFLFTHIPSIIAQILSVVRLYLLLYYPSHYISCPMVLPPPALPSPLPFPSSPPK